MKTTRTIHRKTGVFAACWATLLACAVLTAGSISQAQTPPANLSPDLQEIVKFAQAKMSDDVILAYIKNSGKAYNLSGDDMIYLTSQGVSQPVLSALLQTKINAAPAPAPAPAPQQIATPSTPPPGVSVQPPMAAAPPPYTPPPGLIDNFTTDGGLNPSIWSIQTPLLQNLAQWNGAASMPPMMAFSPAGLQLSGVNGPGQFTGIQSAGVYAAPFSVTARVSALSAEGVPFELSLVSPDLRQWLSVAAHVGGMGEARGGLGIRTPFGGVRVPMGGPSPDHGVWANWTGSGQPISALGSKIYPAPVPSVPYTVTLTVTADGMGSVSFQDAAGFQLGAMNSMPVGAGPFHVVLDSRRHGPTFANWQSIELTSLAPAPQPVVMTAPPEVPTFDYFQTHLAPYGQWITVPDAGSVWVPMEANNLEWRPYMDAGHWEYTDAGWFWQSDYPWGDIGFHYGRWIRNEFTGGRWAWAPAYDWAPSWVSWREGDGGMGWAPLPWGVEFHAGVGLFWHGGLVVDGGVGFGLGFDAFVFVGPDHFWGGDYARFRFGPDRARIFYEHSVFHGGFRVEGGHVHFEGLGREHIAAITHHEVVVHKAAELRRTEEHHNFERRVAEHKEVARVEHHEAEAHRAEPGRSAAEHGPTAADHGAPGRPGTTPSRTAPGRPSASGSKSGSSQEKKPN